MGALDWTLFAGYLAVIVSIGAWNARRAETTRGFFVADRSIPWWAVGLSVMATQASAITFIGTTGKGYADGLRFVQFYLGLPIAMVILAFTLVPLYHRSGVLTAYELLGRRFDTKTRVLAALVFLIQRCLSLGIVIYAPSIVLSMLLGWELATTILGMTILAIGYTALGGIRAVIWTDVVQMLLIFAGLGVVAFAILGRLPAGSSFSDALELAQITGRSRVLDFSFDPTNRYTVWSGVLGGTFLFLSYFGCDQSQVQRFLSGRSLRDNRLALAFNALFKLPVQLAVLLIGVLMFSAFHFDQPPLLFDANALAELEAEPQGAALEELERGYTVALDERRQAAIALWDTLPANREQAAERYRAAAASVETLRSTAVALAREVVPGYDDTNSVFPYFVLRYLPAGLAGLLLAAIFAAAMSSIDSELNALSATSVVDIYRPFVNRSAPDGHYVAASRVFTLVWGALAASFALYAGRLGSVIEAVNMLGSYFYGSLLGVFALFATRVANGHGAFTGVLSGVAAVALADARFDVAWLWLNPIGCATTFVVGILVSSLSGSSDDGSVARKEAAIELREQP